jgi:glycine cleavage system H lipoate-binding protein
MNTVKSTKKDLYYTNDHEWIEFRDSLAYTGICSFKLTGFKQIDEIIFIEPAGFKPQGAIIAIIKYGDYQIEAHMPVEGVVVEVNTELISGNHESLLLQPENSGWIAQIMPSKPLELNNLILPIQYKLKTAIKYAVA